MLLLCAALAVLVDPSALALKGGHYRRRPLARPTITQRPDDPSTTRTATFTWTHRSNKVRFHCQVDRSKWKRCSSPLTVNVDLQRARPRDSDRHSFSVRATKGDRRSKPVTYRWHVIEPFEISGDVEDLVPGAWRPIDVVLTNPGNRPVVVTQVLVEVASSPPACPASTHVEIQPSTVSGDRSIEVPPRASVPVPAADRPQIRLKNLPTNQDACKGATFDLVYGGSGTVQ